MGRDRGREDRVRGEGGCIWLVVMTERWSNGIIKVNSISKVIAKLKVKVKVDYFILRTTTKYYFGNCT